MPLTNNQRQMVAGAVLAAMSLSSDPPQRYSAKGHNHTDRGDPAPMVPRARQTGRNQPCPCGSGRKYKHCHLGKATPQ